MALDRRRRPDDRDALDDVRDTACPARGNRSRRARCARFSNTSMNAAPMILRFCSGSVTSASRSRNRSVASTNSSGRPQPRESRRAPARPRSAAAGRCPRRCTSADRRSPGAASSAATVESTPPDSPHTTRPSPTCSRIRADALVDERRHRPVAAAPADAEREVAQDLHRRCSVCTTSGMEQQPVEPRARVLHRGHRRVGRRRDDLEPGRRRRDEVAVARPDLQRRLGTSSNSGAPSTTLTTACPNSRCGARSTCAAERVGHELHAVADAERRRAELRGSPGSVCGAPGSETLFGPPDRMMPAGLRRAISAADVVGGRISE